MVNVSMWKSLLVLTLSVAIILPAPTVQALISPLIPSADSPYILVGGQNGTWFHRGQSPILYQVFLFNNTVRKLMPIIGGGTVWTGGWNGSQWLISGWGSTPDPERSDPYLYLYDGQRHVTHPFAVYDSESSWHGGDVFSTSYNGNEWLITGMGSGILPSYLPDRPVNHLALATFDGNRFTDLSSRVPRQQDGILYTNAWNGKYWLVGGGYLKNGVFLSFDGTQITDLTLQIESVVPTFSSVQSIAWNGNYWLIGGIGFLAKYDGSSFLDLTPELDTIFPTGPSSVNAIAWNGSYWLLGGGIPVALTITNSEGWLARYDLNGFTNLTGLLPYYVSRGTLTSSSILAIRHTGDSWIIGGYSNSHAILFSLENKLIVDRSNLVSSMSYVTWIGGM